MAVTIDRAALKVILLLAADGAATTNARLTERTSEAWQALAMFATAPSGATIILAGADSFPAPSSAVMTVTEAARAMGCSRGHVRRLCRLGAIRARRHGERIWLVDRDAVEDWRKAA